MGRYWDGVSFGVVGESWGSIAPFSISGIRAVNKFRDFHMTTGDLMTYKSEGFGVTL